MADAHRRVPRRPASVRRPILASLLVAGLAMVALPGLAAAADPSASPDPSTPVETPAATPAPTAEPTAQPTPAPTATHAGPTATPPPADPLALHSPAPSPTPEPTSTADTDPDGLGRPDTGARPDADADARADAGPAPACRATFDEPVHGVGLPVPGSQLGRLHRHVRAHDAQPDRHARIAGRGLHLADDQLGRRAGPDPRLGAHPRHAGRRTWLGSARMAERPQLLRLGGRDDGQRVARLRRRVVLVVRSAR